MNTDQWLSLLRTALKFAGGFLVSKGVVSAAGWETLVGSIIAAVPVLWDMYVHSKVGKVSSVASMPEVHKIVTDIPTAVKASDPKVVSHP